MKTAAGGLQHIAIPAPIGPVMGVILLEGGNNASSSDPPPPLPPVLLKSDSASVSLLHTVAVTICKHREAAPARLSPALHHSDENSW